MNDLFGVEWLPLPTAAEMAEIDRRAREEQNVPERLLMENAGRAIAQVVASEFPEGPVVAAVGSGHNGADAFIALRNLRAWGRDVLAVQAGSSPPDPALGHKWEIPLVDSDAAPSAFARAGVVLDGILGTGVTGAPREPQAELIESLNTCGTPVLAVDGPSGVDFSSGAIPGACVQAEITASLGFPKLGLLLQPGRSRCGRLLVAEIGFPPVSDTDVSAAVITPDWARERLPARGPDAHKGDAGYVLVAAGRTGMAGAGVLVARGALTMGAGIVRIASDPDNREIYQTAAPEAIFVDIDDEGALQDAGDWADALIVGPGMGQDDTARGRLERVLSATHASPTLIDADGLNMLSDHPDDLTELGAARPLALTPHPGEMGRLMDRDAEGITADPVAVARSAVERFNASLLLKGAPSVVASSEGPALVSSSGSSAAAVGGSGDVLAGVCGALLAAGLAPRDALAVGLHYCGRAAELGPVRGRSSLELTWSLPDALTEPRAQTPLFPFVLFDQPPRT